MTDALAGQAIDWLLREQIDSFEKLQVLLLLRENRDVAWTPEMVTERLDISKRAAADALHQLCRGSFLCARSGDGRHFWYAPAGGEIATVIDQLADTYERDPVSIIKPIAKNAVDRIRSSAAHAFAQSFSFRRNGRIAR